MDRRYSEDELGQLVWEVETLMGRFLTLYPTEVVDTVVLSLLVRRLEGREAELPGALRTLLRDLRHVQALGVRLCGEGPYEGLPVA